jgi:hypothetical protein
MVPVPEELADDVGRFIQFTVSKAERPVLDHAVVARAMATLDEPCRALLTVSANATAKAGEVTVSRLAALLQCSEREVLGTMLEVNHVMRLGGAAVMLIPQNAPGTSGVDLSERMITMAENVAGAVVAAERLDPADIEPADEAYTPGA